MVSKNYYPVFLDLKDRRCVIVGGGRVAEKKCASLVKAGARINVISPDITKRLAAYKDKGQIRHIKRHYRSNDLDKAFLVIAAANSKETNARVAEDAKKTGILLNVVDAPSLCDFIIPSVVRRGLLTIAVSTGGTSPAMSKYIRKELEKIYGPEYAGYLNRISKARSNILKNIKDRKERERLIRDLVEKHLKAPPLK